jgi:hypothetical protein
MNRDERPYFDNAWGIPWDEAQFACWLAVEGGIKQQLAHEGATLALWWYELLDIDGQAAKFARRASARLRNHPSHKAGGQPGRSLRLVARARRRDQALS